MACQQHYGNRAGLQYFTGQMMKRLAEWFKNCRNATNELVEALELQHARQPERPTIELIRAPSSLWKRFHRLFPLAKNVPGDILAVYSRWVDIATTYRRDNPHGTGDSLFEHLATAVEKGTTHCPPPFS